MNNFHALLAQVIPVLLLAAAFESRVLQRAPMRYGFRRDEAEEADSRVNWDSNIFQSLGMIMILVFIGAGEALAIWCVYTGQHEPWQNAWVLLAGIATLTLVIGPLVALHHSDIKKTTKLLNGPRSLWIYVVVFVFMGLFLVWGAVRFVELIPSNPF